MKGRRLATIEEIRTASLEELKTIPKSASRIGKHKCIISEGDFFEADSVDIDE